ncbi:hypothetical protein O3G_MSEX004874 [Manduca sexta]|uniref:Uncharacterized protein n=1 Tax=Manduca sexta TaxID=7130 RepID=A0A922CHQ8_MANSE|nr:hypothetical protein O3G_MSEX004874 [Manduca sexta]
MTDHCFVVRSHKTGLLPIYNKKIAIEIFRVTKLIFRQYRIMSCGPHLTTHAYLQTPYNCKARLHTAITRTGQRTLLPCTSETDIYIAGYARKSEVYFSRFRQPNEELAACDRDDDIPGD